MIRLVPGDKLQAVLSGAVATTQPQCVVCYSDQTANGYSGGKQLTALNGTSDVDILATPAAGAVRDVDMLSLFNRDTASITPTIKYDISSTDSIIITVTLATLETLIYTHAHGWHCLTSDGKIKVQSGSSLSGSSGDVLYTSAAGTFASESAFNYDATNNILTVDNVRLGVDGTQRFDEHASAPSTPASGNIVTYGKQNGRMYGKDDTGQEFEMFASQRAAGGRLTLSTAIPVMTSDVSGSTSIYYTHYIDNRIALYDGTVWTIWEFSELTNTTTDNTKNPAAVAASKNYDLFVWNDSGTLRLGRGPAWTSDTARGTGAGTTELERVNGTWVNKIAITNGPAAQRGRYVGSVRSNGSSQIDWKLGSNTAGGGAASLFVWNLYNRVTVGGMVRDGTANWSYSSSTFRPYNNSSQNSVFVLAGLSEDQIECVFMSQNDMDSTESGSVGIGIDGSATVAGLGQQSYQVGATVVRGPINAAYAGAVALGYHSYTALEAAIAGTVLFFGFNTGADTTGLQYWWMA